MVLPSDTATKQFGKEFANKVKNGGIICLYGDLGAGKTTFTQGLAEELGINRRIISPTFVIIRMYTVTDYSNFYHIDLYRTSSRHDLGDLGLEEIFTNQQNIVVIEWAEKLGSLLPKKRFDITFSYISENEREAIVQTI